MGYDGCMAIPETGYSEPLPSDEQIKLARRYQDHGDQEAANKLVETNMPWVIQYVSKFKNGPAEFSDLIQAGAVGLCRALNKYDPDSGYKFLSYAKHWVKHETINQTQNSRAVNTYKGSRDSRKISNNFNKISNKIDGNVFTKYKEAAKILGVDEDEVRWNFMARCSPVRLDQSVQDSDTELHEFFEGNSSRADDIVDAKQMLNLLIKFGKTIEDERDKDIWFNRTSMPKGARDTLSDIASRWDVSKERIRQVENKIKGWFEDWFEDQTGIEFSWDKYNKG